MLPFSYAFQKLSNQFGKKTGDSCSRAETFISESGAFNPGNVAQCVQDNSNPEINIGPNYVIADRPQVDEVAGSRNYGPDFRPAKPATRPNSFRGPCSGESSGECPIKDTDSINTFLRPDNLLMGNINIRLDQTKPYLVGNTLMREIPLRDTSRVLNDKELRSIHWVIGESVERHAERTARYFANLFRSRELSDVIIYVKENKIKTHKLVLAAFSPRFHKQFIKERPEKMLMPEVCIDVSQLQTRALLRCIEYMYKGFTEIHHYNAAEVLSVAQALKLFPLANICKTKLKSLYFSDLFHVPPKDRKEAATGVFSQPRAKDKPNIRSGEASIEFKTFTPLPPEPSREEKEEQKRQAEIRAVGKGSVDFYKLTAQSCFLAWPLEMVEALFQNDDIRINSELDVVEAMIRWIQFHPDLRTKHAERLLNCIRFVHTNPHEMLKCKHLVPDLFNNGPLRALMAKAKWTKDLIERGVAAANLTVPRCRVTRTGYWAAPDACETPIDNIYGDEFPTEDGASFSPLTAQRGRAARIMISMKGKKMLCNQIAMTENKSCGIRK